jgi:hypothetical protein
MSVSSQIEYGWAQKLSRRLWGIMALTPFLFRQVQTSLPLPLAVATSAKVDIAIIAPL